MIKYSASKARANFNEVLAMAKRGPVEIQKHGRPAVVILDAMDYEKLVEYIEDLEDDIAALEHELNPGDLSQYVPLDEFLADLKAGDESDSTQISGSAKA